jgi:ATP-dependent DNA helicase RecG
MEQKAKNPLHDPVKYLKGVGPHWEKLLARLGVKTIGDIFYHIPRLYIDRSKIVKIINTRIGEVATILGDVVSFESRRSRKKMEVQTALVKDDSDGMLFLQWFGQPYLKKVIKKGITIMASGEVSFYKGKQMVHPDFEIMTDEMSHTLHTGRIVPFYPLTEGMMQKRIRRIIDNGISLYLDYVEETLPDHILFKEKIIPLKEAIYKIHRPRDFNEISLAKERFIFEELFYLEILLALRKKRLKVQKSKVRLKKDGTLVKSFMETLHFELTNDQKTVVREIRDDFLSEKPMHRMLQGEVGSGKTVVAIIASLMIIESGYQVALMAPTEILAEQHYLNMGKTLGSLGVKNGLLIGSVKEKEKKKIYDSLSSGNINLIFGTHALIEDIVQFKNLGFVIIDEQHRFGVLQRAKLLEKGDTPHFLVMTATPIPRTLSMTLYGDLDISTIKEMPPGRKEIVTRWTHEKNRKKLYDFIKEKIGEGDQCFIIYPLVEESEKVDLKAATEMYHHLKETVFKTEGVGLIHGRMKTEEKEEVMRAFRNKDIMVLVSTTVIEVGIDMPDATIMVIEHPERFGLAQLHQMRGRVGRGDKKSYCILFSPYKISDEAKERLKTIESTRDGFKIAEKDLEIRGPGEFFGTAQHGLPDLKFSNLVTDWNTLQRARRRAFDIIDEDPQLLKEENRRVRDRYIEKYREKDRLGDVL